jgi:hypothetical protein
MQPRLIIGFDVLTQPQFLIRMQTIGGGLENNLNFPLPWPPEILSPAALVAAVKSFTDDYNAASNGDRALITARDKSRVSLTGKVQKIAHYLEIVADGDVAKLSTSGFELRHDIVKSVVVDPLGLLTGLTLTRGVLPGTLDFHAKAEPKALSYYLQLCSGDPAVEANWTDVGEYPHCNRIKLTGLTAGKTYYVRIRAFNKAGHGLWTTSAGMLVL